MPVPKKRVTSPYIQEQITKFLEQQGEIFKVPVFVDNPPAARASKTGRPDLFVDFGPVHFRIEVKARGNEEPTDNQQDYQRRDGAHVFGRSFTLGGLEQLDYFKRNFTSILGHIAGAQAAALERFGMESLEPIAQDQFGPIPADVLPGHADMGEFNVPTDKFGLGYRIVMKDNGVAPMWDSKHIEATPGDSEEMDQPG